MKDTTFAVILGVEIILALNGLSLFSFFGIILSVLMFGICSLIVLAFYFILLKTKNPPKNKKNFYKKGVLILFGICSVIPFVLSIVVMMRI